MTQLLGQSKLALTSARSSSEQSPEELRRFIFAWFLYPGILIHTYIHLGSQWDLYSFIENL